MVRADVVAGGIWIVLGVAIAIGSWRMDRLETQGVPWFTVPGLVPGVLGCLITLTALAILLRALRAADGHAAEARAAEGRAADGAGDEPPPAMFTRSAAITFVLCLGFAAGMVGRGVPFWAAAAVYLFLHIFLLQLPERRATHTVGRGVLVAAAIALIASNAIAYIFQELFLVRLP